MTIMFQVKKSGDERRAKKGLRVNVSASEVENNIYRNWRVFVCFLWSRFVIMDWQSSTTASNPPHPPLTHRGHVYSCSLNPVRSPVLLFSLQPISPRRILHLHSFGCPSTSNNPNNNNNYYTEPNRTVREAWIGPDSNSTGSVQPMNRTRGPGDCSVGYWGRGTPVGGGRRRD